MNPSHPDKVADRIAGAIVDFAYQKEENPKIAVEVLIGHGKCYVIIETSVEFENVEIDSLVKQIAGDVITEIIAVKQDKHLAKNQDEKMRCGDNGKFKVLPLTE